ncbi:sensor histidine kinase [Lutibaculum baratangense]|uniref:histidine kinase n=1 Tax=Lutibaculum baratangense AMV1 TaxID=631454 RepID=V4RQV6_9HYPH|nr:sensor histidine kinase [Lutibaculum baratangense]ESR25520.1 hypothetical protein N177_1632 [Lutibaculum baratangense AMV1]
MSDFESLAAFVREPLLVIEGMDRIAFANRAAMAAFGRDVAGRELRALLAGPEEDFARYLRRASGSSSPIIGSAPFRLASGECRKVQIEAALLSPDGARSRLILRCRMRGPEEFSVLQHKIKSLNAEIRKRQQIQVMLEEALDQKSTLLRELHHRTRNHTQMLIGMFSAAAAQAESEETRALVEGALARLRAIAAAQQLMYEMERLNEVSGRRLVETVCTSVAASAPSDVEIAVDAEDADFSNDVAVPLALVLNELLSNALKHGLRFGPGRVEVSLRREGRDLVLRVADPGRSVQELPAGRRLSGLSIVRGLCRQIGGTFEITNEGCTVASVRMVDPGLGEVGTR